MENTVLLIVRFTFTMHFVLSIRLLVEITANTFYQTILGSKSISNLFKI